jgi:hypothetical protein
MKLMCAREATGVGNVAIVLAGPMRHDFDEYMVCSLFFFSGSLGEVQRFSCGFGFRDNMGCFSATGAVYSSASLDMAEGMDIIITFGLRFLFWFLLEHKSPVHNIPPS